MKLYDKLVRDNIPQIIKNDGKIAEVVFVKGQAKTDYLFKKLREEVDEFSQSKSEEELSDVLEVIDALKESLNLSNEKINQIKADKKLVNGGFELGIVLKSVDDMPFNIILRCINTLNFKYGIATICSVLYGSESAKIVKNKLNQNPYYCGLKCKSSKSDTIALIDQMISDGYLVTREGLYPCVGLTEKGNDYLMNIDIK